MEKKEIEIIYRKNLFRGGAVSYVDDSDDQLYFIRKYLHKNYNAIILDAGCGEGKYIRKLCSLGYKNLWGVDLFSFTPKGVNNYISASIDRIPLTDNTFDLIYSLSVIFYLDKPIKAFKEFFRILKPGGYVIISAHTKYSLFTLYRIVKRMFKLSSVKHLEGVSFYSSLEYKKMMEKEGFKIIEMDGYRLSFFFYRLVPKFFKLIGIKSSFKKLDQNRRNKFFSFLRSIFCYHSILVGYKDY